MTVVHDRPGIGPPYKWKWPKSLYGQWFCTRNTWHFYDHTKLYIHYISMGPGKKGGDVYEVTHRHSMACGKYMARTNKPRTRWWNLLLGAVRLTHVYKVRENKFCPICYEKAIEQYKAEGRYDRLIQLEQKRTRKKAGSNDVQAK
jgi:hypothetical protein